MTSIKQDQLSTYFHLFTPDDNDDGVSSKRFSGNCEGNGEWYENLSDAEHEDLMRRSSRSDVVVVYDTAANEVMSSWDAIKLYRKGGVTLYLPNRKDDDRPYAFSWSEVPDEAYDIPPEPREADEEYERLLEGLKTGLDR